MSATDKEKALTQALSEKGRRLLRQLGTTRGQVAATLRRAGIKGYREDTDQCPVANWLNERIASENALCCVGDNWVQLWPLPIRGDVYCEIDTPEPVRDFIEAFDKEERYASLAAE